MRLRIEGIARDVVEKSLSLLICVNLLSLTWTQTNDGQGINALKLYNRNDLLIGIYNWNLIGSLVGVANS